MVKLLTNDDPPSNAHRKSKMTAHESLSSKSKIQNPKLTIGTYVRPPHKNTIHRTPRPGTKPGAHCPGPGHLQTHRCGMESPVSKRDCLTPAIRIRSHSRKVLAYLR